jgi:hypothetical protein
MMAFCCRRRAIYILYSYPLINLPGFGVCAGSNGLTGFGSGMIGFGGGSTFGFF